MSAFLERLRSYGKVQLKIAEAYAAFRRARPELVGTGEFYERVLAALVELENDGHVSLPKKSAWDRSVKPRMPKTVSLGRREARQVRDAVAWVPALAFAARITHPTTHADLAAVNGWLAQRGDARRPCVPTQERSLEIFGDEKRLDAIRSGDVLFGGRIALADLDAAVVDPPLGHERGPRPGPILVIENLASFDSFCRHNADPISGHPFGAVAWGAGRAFQKSWSRLEDIARHVHTSDILYLGDIDPDGIDILAAAVAQASTRRLALRPHVGLYEWLICNGPRVPRTKHTQPELKRPASAICGLPLITLVQRSLFPPGLAAAIAEILYSGCRIPQEALGLEALRRFPREQLALVA